MIEHLAKQLAKDFDSFMSGEKPGQDKLKALLEASLRKANLVTREEFDAQAAVLQRSREKLTALEDKIKQLEAQLG